MKRNSYGVTVSKYGHVSSGVQRILKLDFKPLTQKSCQIYKVQTPVFAIGERRALVYNESRDDEFFVLVTEELEFNMQAEPKLFFYGRTIGDTFYLGSIAPWQSW